MKRVLMIFVLVAGVCSVASAQYSNRMQKDLEVFETMLEEYLMQNTKQSNHFAKEKVKATYFEGFGVVVRLEKPDNKHHSWAFEDQRNHYRFMDIQEPFEQNFQMDFYPEKNIILNRHKRGKKIIIENNKVMEFDFDDENEEKSLEKVEKKPKKELKKMKKEAEKREKEAEAREKRAEAREKESEELKKSMIARIEENKKKEDSLYKVREVAFENRIKDFMTTYGFILSELKPTERIRCIYINPQIRNIQVSWQTGDISGSYAPKDTPPQPPTALDFYKKDIDDLRAKIITEEQFQQKVKKVNLEDKGIKQSEDMLGSILEKNIRMVEPKGVFRHLGKTESLYLEGFGVEYHTQLIAHRKPIEIEEDVFIMSENKVIMKKKKTDNKDKNTEQDKNGYEKKLKEFANNLEEQAKDDLLSYGKILLPILKNMEKITWQIELLTTKSFDEVLKKDNLTKKITLVLLKEDLEAYDTKKISLAEAKNKIKIQKQ